MGVKKKVKRIIVIFLITILVLGGIFVFGGDDTGEDKTSGFKPGEIVSYIDENW
jgi:hypothetical protein